MRFTVNNIDYEAIEKNGTFSGYFYKTENGKKTRISRAAFEAAETEHIDAQAKTYEDEEIDEMDKAFEQENNSTVEDKPAKKKTKKSRKSKDIAFSMHIATDNTEETDANLITLTAKQVDFMKHLPDTCFWENGLDSEVWVDCLCDDIGGQFKNKPMTVGAMISTLCEKGIGARGVSKVNGHKATAFKLTEIGKVIAAELGVR